MNGGVAELIIPPMPNFSSIHSGNGGQEAQKWRAHVFKPGKVRLMISPITYLSIFQQHSRQIYFPIVFIALEAPFRQFPMQMRPDAFVSKDYIEKLDNGVTLLSHGKMAKYYGCWRDHQLSLLTA